MGGETVTSEIVERLSKAVRMLTSEIPRVSIGAVSSRFAPEPIPKVNDPVTLFEFIICNCCTSLKEYK